MHGVNIYQADTFERETNDIQTGIKENFNYWNDYIESKGINDELQKVLRKNMPTITDVINSAEDIFNTNWVLHDDGTKTATTIRFYIETIMRMCRADKSIEEISEYIVNNIK